ncbi:MAG: response regulator [Flavobacterium sp.]
MKNISTIYIVDNDPIYQLVIKKLLQKMLPSTNLFSFMDGSEAWEKLCNLTNEKVPCIILLDLDMPLMDGWEFMEMFDLWKHPEKNNIQIYIVSSSIAKEDIEKSNTYSSIVDYITKPISLASLEKILLK